MPHDSSVVSIMEVATLVKALRERSHGTPDCDMHCPWAAPFIWG